MAAAVVGGLVRKAAPEELRGGRLIGKARGRHVLPADAPQFQREEQGIELGPVSGAQAARGAAERRQCDLRIAAHCRDAGEILRASLKIILPPAGVT